MQYRHFRTFMMFMGGFLIKILSVVSVLSTRFPDLSFLQSSFRELPRNSLVFDLVITFLTLIAATALYKYNVSCQSSMTLILSD